MDQLPSRDFFPRLAFQALLCHQDMINALVKCANHLTNFWPTLDQEFLAKVLSMLDVSPSTVTLSGIKSCYPIVSEPIDFAKTFLVSRITRSIATLSGL